MPTRTAKAVWKGSIKKGSGQVELGKGGIKGQYSFESRFESGSGTNPEELLAGAHASCYAMALSLFLGQAGFKPESVDATSSVTIQAQGGGFTITGSDLSVEAKVPGIDEAKFIEIAEKAKNECPVSRALGAIKLTVNAKLVK